MNNGPQKGGSPATVQLLKSAPSIQALYQLHRTQTSADENTDPAFIANHDPAGGQFIQVNVEPDGTSFHVRIGEDGRPKRTFESSDESVERTPQPSTFAGPLSSASASAGASSGGAARGIAPGPASDELLQGHRVAPGDAPHPRPRSSA